MSGSPLGARGRGPQMPGSIPCALRRANSEGGRGGDMASHLLGVGGHFQAS